MTTTDARDFILSIETATPVCSVALHNNGFVTGITEIFADKSHSRHLVPMIQELMKYAGAGFSALKAVAVSRGPGSYTGLRIGVSTAKGICFAHDIALIGVDTLEAMARQMFPLSEFRSSLVCPMLDARRMEVYTMLMKDDGTIVEPVHAEIINETSFLAHLANHKIIFAGPGAVKCRAVIGSHPNAVFIEGIEASARTVGEIANKLFLEQRFENTASFEPFYLKEYQTTVPRKRL